MKLRYTIKIALVSLLFLAGLTNAGNDKKVILNLKLTKPPVATRQLGPAIFFNKEVLKKLDVKEGYPVKVKHDGNVEYLRVYFFFGDSNEFAIRKEYTGKLGVVNGFNVLAIQKATPEEAGITPKPIEFKVENYKGDLSKWNGYAFGAPHGDCDNETGAVVKRVAENYGIPATAAYGCRVSYRGIWYDCNRPLMKLPKPGNRGVYPERQWNKAAEKKYQIYQDSVWANSKLKFGKRFKMFCSFHGHDLTVKLPDGKRIQRPVIEGIGVGFTKNELRRIKKFYYRITPKLYENPPSIYFGNLPEDLVYEYEGVKLNFFYSGLGTRTYGSLRSDLVENALHLETPDNMRLGEEVQKKTAKLLFELYSFIRDSIFTARKSQPVPQVVTKPVDLKAKKIIPAGEFIMGAPAGKGWSAEHPQHRVYLDQYAIDVYEVTNLQFANYLNEALKKNEIVVQNGIVKNAKDTTQKYFLTKTYSPFSQIEFNSNTFSVVKGKEYFPVIYVTYYGAKAYAKHYGEDLPTEAEWEKAASWAGGKKYFFATSKDTMTEQDANFEDSGDPFEGEEIPCTTPVGFYKMASPYGVKDMSGNVWEWCSDNYVYGYYRTIKDSVVFNPKGPESSTMKTIRGGAWNTEPFVTRATMRLGINPNAALVNLGFRCVKRTNGKLKDEK